MTGVSEAQRREDALRSALARLPFAVLIVDHRRVLQPFNESAASLMQREGIAGNLIDARPAHPLSGLVRKVLEAPAGAALAGVDLTFPSGRAYRVEPSRRSEKGFERWLVLLLSEQKLREIDPADRFRQWDLTSRECDVAAAIAQGKSTESICAELGIAVTTLKSHVAQILKKSGSRSRNEFLARLLQGD